MSLIPCTRYTDRSAALRLVCHRGRQRPRRIAGRLCAFHQLGPAGAAPPLEAAQHHGLNVDLHVDEELHPGAQGQRPRPHCSRELGLKAMGLQATPAPWPQDEATALATLDAVAQSPITLVTLPITNLAAAGRHHRPASPRQRGLTLVKEARARGIPVLVASDNVQDPFCPVGSFDPLEALATGVLAAQLGAPFDQ